MSRFQVFDNAVPDQRKQWLQHFEEWPEREVSAHPDYVRLFARPCDRSLCASFQSEEGQVLFPFILRPLAQEPWAGQSAGCDLTSPYGYGGPFAWNLRDEGGVAGEFWKHFAEWAQSVQAVSLFARLSLFPNQMIPFDGDVERSASNVVRLLDLDSEKLWMDYEHKVRKNVGKARRAELEVEVDLDGRRLSEFLAIYYSTMERREAANSYYFPKAFFQNIVAGLKGQFTFFHTLQEDRVVSTELVLVSQNHLYSFLGGTLAEAFDLRPNELLKHAIIEWGRENGKHSFVLGGGYQERDGIFRYKLSYAPHGEVPFFVGQRVYDQAAYELLAQQRHDWQIEQNSQWTPRAGFFPLYRA